MRVVGGRLRGRPLRAPPGRRTRPTSDRARGGLFDWIGPGLEGARVADLFAGTGALGIEALSRGAAEAVFVEQSREARSALHRNLEALGLVDCARILAYDVRRAARRLVAEGIRFDWVFLDPPYGGAGQEVEEVEQLLEPGGRVVVERSSRESERAPGPGLTLRGSRRFGETRFDRYEREGEPGA